MIANNAAKKQVDEIEQGRVDTHAAEAGHTPHSPLCHREDSSTGSERADDEAIKNEIATPTARNDNSFSSSPGKGFPMRTEDILRYQRKRLLRAKSAARKLDGRLDEMERILIDVTGVIPPRHDSVYRFRFLFYCRLMNYIEKLEAHISLVEDIYLDELAESAGRCNHCGKAISVYMLGGRGRHFYIACRNIGCAASPSMPADAEELMLESSREEDVF